MAGVYVPYVMTQQTTRMDETTMNDAVDRITSLPGVTEGTNNTVWCTFNASDDTQFSGAVSAALKCRGVVLHKADREEGFVSVMLEEYAED